MLDSRPKGRGFEPHRRHYVVSLSKNINPSLVLVQPRKTRPSITERLLMGRKESNQTNKQTNKKDSIEDKYKWQLIRVCTICIETKILHFKISIKKYSRKGITGTCQPRYLKVRKVAKMRNRYNQVPHLTQDNL